MKQNILDMKKNIVGMKQKRAEHPHPEPGRQRNHQQTMNLPPGPEFELILAGRPKCFFMLT